MKKQAVGQHVQRTNLMDARFPNFGERIEGSGRRSYFYSCKINGKHFFHSFGAGLSRQEAKTLATVLVGRIGVWKQNGCPDTEASPFHRAKRYGTPKFSEIFEAYIAQHVRTSANRPKKAEAAVRWMAGKYFGAFWDKRVDLISTNDIVELKKSFGEKKHSANRCVQTLKAIFRWATKSVDGKPPLWRGESPAASVTLFPEVGREEYLSPDELDTLYRELEREPSQDLRDFLVIALDTGVRKMNIVGARWEHVSEEAASWKIPLSKSGKSYFVSLSPDAVKIFQRRRRDNERDSLDPDNPRPYVFPSRLGGHRGGLFHEWDKFRQRCGFPHIRLHDLRRTCGAQLAMSGANTFSIQRILGHASAGAVAFYAKLSDEAAKAALAKSLRYRQTKMIAARKATKRLQAVNP